MTHRRLINWTLCTLVGTLIVTGGIGAWIAGCNITVDETGVSTTFTIGGKTVTLKLGLAGLFNVGPAVTETKIADANDFLGGTPTDNPSSGTVRLRPANVTVRAPVTGKETLTLQGITGIARLRWAIDAPGAVDPCQTGIDLGTFEIQVAPNGVINIVDEELSLTLAAVSLFLENNISMCLQMESDFAGVVQISGFDVIFGPSEDEAATDRLTGTFQRSNLGLTNVNLLAPGEEAGDANLFTPGLVRNSVFGNLSINDLLTFRAVRNGVVVDTATCPRVNQGDFFAIVEWDGFTLTCFQPVTPPDLGPERGCCLPGRTEPVCADITPQACENRGGFSAGPNLFCDDIECLGACCRGGGSCELRTLESCRAVGGDYQGFAVDCDPNPCPQPPPGVVPMQAWPAAPAGVDGFLYRMY